MNRTLTRLRWRPGSASRHPGATGRLGSWAWLASSAATRSASRPGSNPRRPARTRRPPRRRTSIGMPTTAASTNAMGDPAELPLPREERGSCDAVLAAERRHGRPAGLLPLDNLPPPLLGRRRTCAHGGQSAGRPPSGEDAVQPTLTLIGLPIRVGMQRQVITGPLATRGKESRHSPHQE